ncbi:MAG: hypothetical protein PW843_09895 [Azospirillaceae bacterium]|nr:hypothetical protein [Azospirillaceae bacterium]
MPNFSTENWMGGRHPTGAPSYMEYTPLLKADGGVPHLTPEMAFERFLPPDGFDGALTPGEVAYVRLLIDHARTVGKCPVLTDTRTLGRSAALKKAFGGAHVLLYRNPFYQWCSYNQLYLAGSKYFVETIDRILPHCGQDKFLRDLALLYPGANKEPNRKTLIVFLFLHIYLYYRNMDVADLMIDIDMLTNDEYRVDAEEKLSAFCGTEVDLGGYRPSICFSTVNDLDMNEMRELLNNIPDMFMALDQSPDGPSPAGQAMVRKCRDDFLEALERYRHYAGFLTRYVFGRDGLKERLDVAQGIALTRRRERDQAMVELNAAHAAQGRLETEMAFLQQERDLVSGELSAARAELERLRGGMAAAEAPVAQVMAEEQP